MHIREVQQGQAGEQCRLIVLYKNCFRAALHLRRTSRPENLLNRSALAWTLGGGAAPLPSEDARCPVCTMFPTLHLSCSHNSWNRVVASYPASHDDLAKGPKEPESPRYRGDTTRENMDYNASASAYECNMFTDGLK